MKINMKICVILIVITVVLCVTPSSKNETLPVVIWHGMGDTCCLPFSMGVIKSILHKYLNNTYVYSIKVGKWFWDDFFHSFEMHPNKQISDVCIQIQNDSKLQNGFNAIGFSQGGQFL